jgi:hypothetical protein
MGRTRNGIGARRPRNLEPHPHVLFAPGLFLVLLCIGLSGILAQAAAPPNNNFANAQLLAGTGGSTNGSNVSATKESGEPDHAGNPGGRSIWYRWTAPTNLSATFSTAGSTAGGSADPLDTLLAIYTGNTLATLEEVVGDDDGNDDGTSQAVFVASAGTTYRIAVDGFDGAVGTVRLSWNTGPPNDLFEFPQVLQGLTGAVHAANAGASSEPDEPFHAGIAGGRSIWFAWTAPADGAVMFSTAGSSFNTLLATYTGQSVDDLTLVAANDDASGTNASEISFSVLDGQTYLIAVDGNGGATGAVTLGWTLAVTPPSNDSFTSAQSLSGIAGQWRGNSIGATREPGEPDPAGVPGGSSVWFLWTAARTETVTFDTRGSDFDTVLAIYLGSDLISATPVASNDNDGTNIASRVSFTAAVGESYRVVVDGKSGAQGHFTLSWLTASATAANDHFTNAEPLSGFSGSVTGITLLASRETGEPNHAGVAGGRSIWYRWTAPASVRMSFTTEGSNFDTLLAVYRGSAVSALTIVASNNNLAPGNVASRVTFNGLAGTTYQVVVDGTDGAGGTVLLGWAAVLPSIGSFTPTNGTGGASVTISGQGFFGASSVQFNGVPASFSVNADDRITAVVPANALAGPITVTTPAGTATSTAAFLVPLPRLTIGSLNATHILLSWPGTPSGFILQYSTNLSDPSAWANVTTPAVISGNERFLTNSVTGILRWFRLRR